MKDIDNFELTIGMIPRRGPAVVKEDDADEGTAESKSSEPTERLSGGTGTTNPLMKIAPSDEAKGFMKDELTGAAQEKALEMVGDTTGDAFEWASDMAELAMTKGGKAFDINDRGEAAILTKMREAGQDDLDITFVGMGIVLKRAVLLITKGLEKVDSLEIPDCTWLVKPWKVAKQKATGAVLQRFQAELRSFSQQLQNIIQVASYAVQLESLMDASAALGNVWMRKFWKAKIGIDKSRCQVRHKGRVFLQHCASVIFLVARHFWIRMPS